ncbi:hypothetical protein U1Q18_021710 [Sarracenia purpurea var. burkii]
MDALRVRALIMVGIVAITICLTPPTYAQVQIIGSLVLVIPINGTPLTITVNPMLLGTDADVNNPLSEIKVANVSLVIATNAGTLTSGNVPASISI